MSEAAGSGAVYTLAVLCGFAIDAACGEPPARWHPVVWMGRALEWSGAPWPGVTRAGAFLRGLGVWITGAAASMAVAALAAEIALLTTRALPRPWDLLLQGLLLGVLLKPLLAWRLLHAEVAAVERALAISVAAGRERLQWLVSRETAALSATQVRESALESLAENLNDSFVAPLFWFAIGGLPAAALYRFANTADAMWGYRGRWEWAGKCSARADDVLSYVPARVTAVLIAMAALCWPRGLWRQAGKTPSPNGGWPMAMMALALNVRLSKPDVYVLHADGRAAAAGDCCRGLRIATRAARLAVAAACVAIGGARALTPT